MERADMNPDSGHRLIYMDSLKLLASLLVFTVHFIVIFAPGLTSYWTQGWSSYFLYGISGKLAVCFFFVTAGYFAVRKCEVGKYIVRRYLRLAIPVLIVESLIFVFMFVFNLMNIQPFPIDINNQYLNLQQFDYRMFLKSIIFLDDSIVSTYWCNWKLFVGPVFLVILTGLNLKIKDKYIVLILSCIAFYLIGEVWYTLCVMGGIFYLFMSNEYRCMHNWWVKAILVITIYFLIRHPDSNWAFFLKGIACTCLMAVIAYSPYIQKILEIKMLRRMSSYSWEIYLLHTPVNLFIVYFVYGVMTVIGVNWKVTVLVCYMLSLAGTFLLSKYLHIVTDRVLSCIYKKFKLNNEQR